MLRISLVILFASLSCAELAASPPADLDAYIGRTMRTFEVPGAAIALVEPDRPAYTKGYGVRKLGSAARVDERTLFPIASNSKAFTATALALLVDEGKLAWDDKVVDRLPGFRMYDAYTTHELTIRDLLVHRSGLGLGAGDMLFWPGTTFTREELVHRLRYLEPVTSFRSSYAYDNVLYVVAGEVVRAVSGQSWEDFVSQRIFTPLGMAGAVPAFGLVRGDNRSWPHARLSGEARGFGDVAPLDVVPNVDNAAPAGGINASAADMARWLRVQLDRGVFEGRRLFSEQVARDIWSPQVIIPVTPEPAPVAITTPMFKAYGLGFNVRDYRGKRLITHEGWLEGAISLTMLIPDERVGFIVMMNAEEDEARYAIAYRLLDHYLKFPSRDWLPDYLKVRDERLSAARKVLAKRPGAAGASGTGGAKAAGPSLDVASYAGTYHDRWYGDVTIAEQGGALSITFERTPGMQGALEHVRFDTFRTRFTNRRMEDAYLTFSLKPDGSVLEMRMEAVSPLADFSFDYGDLRFTPGSSRAESASR
jgi:CubicO group peptidase (beta-lactamase class C family)